VNCTELQKYVVLFLTVIISLCVQLLYLISLKDIVRRKWLELHFPKYF